jgi:hypothetical protein
MSNEEIKTLTDTPELRTAKIEAISKIICNNASEQTFLGGAFLNSHDIVNVADELLKHFDHNENHWRELYEKEKEKLSQLESKMHGFRGNYHE